jgi:hypothetical protein
MFKTQSVVLATALALLAPIAAAAQEEADHAPDGRAPRLIRPLYIGPKANAPFTATARTEWVETLPDNSTITHWNERAIARDADGRIVQERRFFVPKDGNQQPGVRVVEYSDPAKHTVYTCSPRANSCSLSVYFPRPEEAMAAEGLQPDGRTFLTRENLGVEAFGGLQVQHSRGTYTFYGETIGNTQTILRTVEYWYSPELGVNVKVVRHDPRDGDQTLWLENIDLSAPDPARFQIPQDYPVYDRRVTQPMNRTDQDQPQQ